MSPRWLSLGVVLGLAFAAAARPQTLPADFQLTEGSLRKTLAALQQMQARNVPLNLESKSVEESIAGLKKQAQARGIIKKQKLSLREFVLTYKTASQIRQAQKSREEWQRTLLDPQATAAQKLEATQNLSQDWQRSLGTPEQIELVTRHLPDLDKLLPPQP